MNLKGRATDATDATIALEESSSETNKPDSNLNSSDSSSSQISCLSRTLQTKSRLRLTRGNARRWQNFTRKRSHSHGSVKMAGIGTSDELFVDDSDIILQESVQLTSCFQTQQRYLILLNSTLVVTKQRASATFHVKDQVQLSEIWLADCVDQVSEVMSDHERSFVIGWPTVNMVATFSSVEVKDAWLDRLHQQIALEKSHNWPKNIVIKIINNSQEFSVTKHMLVGNCDDAKTILNRCIQEMHILRNSVDDFQFWVQSDRENHPYPLIGHEYPYAIQMSYLREKQGVERLTGQTDSLCCDGIKFQVMPKHVKSKLSLKLSLDETRTPKKSSKIIKLFKKSSRSVDIGNIFGRDLNYLFRDGLLCPPVLDILTHLYLYGPSTVDIFRKSAIISKCQEVKHQLDHGGKIDFNDLHVFISAALLKELLRSLPNCLLLCEFYSKWIKISAILENRPVAIHRIQNLVDLLPSNHRTFLKYLMCILHEINERSERNGMTAYSLSVCISQTLLWQRSPSGVGLTQVSDAKKLNAVIELMIESTGEIFGEDCLYLFDRLKPRWNEERKVDSVSNGREVSQLDRVQEESQMADFIPEFDAGPSDVSENLSPPRTLPTVSCSKSNIAADDITTRVASTAVADVNRLSVDPIGDLSQSFSVNSHSSVSKYSKEPNRCNIGDVDKWFRSTFEDDSQFVLDTENEFGALIDINSNLPDSLARKKILEAEHLMASTKEDDSSTRSSHLADVAGCIAESALATMINLVSVVEDQNEIAPSSDITAESSLLGFQSDLTSLEPLNSPLPSLNRRRSLVDGEQMDAIENIPETSAVFDAKESIKQSSDVLKSDGSCIRREDSRSSEQARPAESSTSDGSVKLASKSNLLRLRRGMTEGGGDLFPKQFVERLHCALTEASSSGNCLKVKNPISEGNVLMEKGSSVCSNRQTPLLSTTVRPTPVQQSERQNFTALRGSRPYHQQQGTAIAAALRAASYQKHRLNSWQNVPSAQCYSNGPRVRPTKPPSYEEALAEKKRQSLHSPQATLVGDAGHVTGSCDQNRVWGGRVAYSRLSLDDPKSRNFIVTESIACNAKPDVAMNERNRTLNMQIDDSNLSKFGRKFIRKIPNHAVVEEVNQKTRRVLPEYNSKHSILTDQNRSNVDSNRNDKLSSDVVESIIDNVLHKSIDSPGNDNSIANSRHFNRNFVTRQGLDRGVGKRRRQRQHFSDPKLRTCTPVCLGLGRSKSDSCEFIGRKCNDCANNKENVDNLVYSNSFLKRKLAAMQQLSSTTQQNRFPRMMNPVSSELTMVKEDVSPAEKCEMELSYSPKDLKKIKSVVLLPLNANLDSTEVSFHPRRETRGNNDTDNFLILDDDTSAHLPKPVSYIKDAPSGDYSLPTDDQVLRPPSSDGISAKSRLLCVVRSAKSLSPEKMNVNWSVSELKQALYKETDNNSDCPSVTKSSRMIPLHEAPYFV